MTDEEQLIAMQNCHRVRTACPVRSLSVLPDPHSCMNVQVKLYNGQYVTMHVSDALAFVRMTYRKHRAARTPKRMQEKHSLRMRNQRIRREIAMQKRKEYNMLMLDADVDSVIARIGKLLSS